MVFKPGETLKYIDITIIDDNEWEENEVFFVMLTPYDIKDTSVSIGKQSISEVTIINDDGKKLLAIKIRYTSTNNMIAKGECSSNKWNNV